MSHERIMKVHISYEQLWHYNLTKKGVSVGTGETKAKLCIRIYQNLPINFILVSLDLNVIYINVIYIDNYIK